MERIKTIVFLATDIYTSLGPGYNEVIYHRAFEVALRLNGIIYETEVVTPVFYKGHNIGHGRVDLKLEDLIIELKAVNSLNNDAIIQIKNYMNHYSINTGLVINFGQTLKTGLGILFIANGVIHDLVNGTFIARNELNVI
jgi:GxxExxY protein